MACSHDSIRHGPKPWLAGPGQRAWYGPSLSSTPLAEAKRNSWEADPGSCNFEPYCANGLAIRRRCVRGLRASCTARGAGRGFYQCVIGFKSFPTVRCSPRLVQYRTSCAARAGMLGTAGRRVLRTQHRATQRDVHLVTCISAPPLRVPWRKPCT